MFPRSCRTWVVRAVEERNVQGLDTSWQIVIIREPEIDSVTWLAYRQAAASLEKVSPAAQPLIERSGAFLFLDSP